MDEVDVDCAVTRGVFHRWVAEEEAAPLGLKDAGAWDNDVRDSETRQGGKGEEICKLLPVRHVGMLEEDFCAVWV